MMNVDTVNPPIMVMPIGCQFSEPSPLEMAIGSNPTRVVIVVINTGRNRSFPPMVTASNMECPRARRILIKLISTIALFTTIPISMTIPKNEFTFKVMPVSKNAQITPVKVKGTENMMMNGSSSYSNCAAMTI